MKLASNVFLLLALFLVPLACNESEQPSTPKPSKKEKPIAKDKDNEIVKPATNKPHTTESKTTRPSEDSNEDIPETDDAIGKRARKIG